MLSDSLGGARNGNAWQSNGNPGYALSGMGTRGKQQSGGNTALLPEKT